MRNLLLAVAIVALLPVSAAIGEQPRAQKSDKPVASGKRLPLKGAGNNDSCAAYGAGFAKVEGTSTCMKIGGAIGIGAGVSSGGR
jgi:hypothetical protein